MSRKLMIGVSRCKGGHSDSGDPFEQLPWYETHKRWSVAWQNEYQEAPSRRQRQPHRRHWHIRADIQVCTRAWQVEANQGSCAFVPIKSFVSVFIFKYVSVLYFILQRKRAVGILRNYSESFYSRQRRARRTTTTAISKMRANSSILISHHILCVMA